MFLYFLYSLCRCRRNIIYFIYIVQYCLLNKNTSTAAAAAAAKSLQSCPTLCDPIDRSPPGSPVPGILQARTLEWVAISLSNAWKWKVKVKVLCRIGLFATPQTIAYQALLSMGFSRQEYWSGVPSSSPTRWVRNVLFYHLNKAILTYLNQIIVLYA